MLLHDKLNCLCFACSLDCGYLGASDSDTCCLNQAACSLEMVQLYRCRIRVNMMIFSAQLDRSCGDPDLR